MDEPMEIPLYPKVGAGGAGGWLYQSRASGSTSAHVYAQVYVDREGLVHAGRVQGLVHGNATDCNGLVHVGSAHGLVHVDGTNARD